MTRREALLVHMMEKLSGDLDSFARLERETTPDETWSRYDRALGRAVLLANRRQRAGLTPPKPIDPSSSVQVIPLGTRADARHDSPRLRGALATL